MRPVVDSVKQVLIMAPYRSEQWKKLRGSDEIGYHESLRGE
jgi:hypothetical protein